MAQLTITEKLKYILPGAIVSAIVNVLLNILLIPEYGTIGAAIASSFTGLVSASLLFYYGNKCFKLPIQINKIIFMYFLLFVYTGIYYYLLSININMFQKIILKLLILSSFIIPGVKLEFISSTKLKEYLKI